MFTMATEVIFVRVNRKVREEAMRLGLDVLNVIASALEEAVSQKGQTGLREAVDDLKKEMKV